MKQTLMFLSVLVLSFSALAVENDPAACGRKGSIEERIEDCSAQEDADVKGFILVSRSPWNTKIIYKEKATGLLWSSVVGSFVDQKEAELICEYRVKSISNIKGLSWRLPTDRDFRRILSKKIHNSLPSMNVPFWTSTMDVEGKSMAYFEYFAYSPKFGGLVTTSYEHESKSVRCVAKSEDK